MKKLYKKGTVHPRPSVVSDQLLSFLPAAMLTLAAALSTEDREVLAYLISCSSANCSDGHRKNAQKSVARGSSNYNKGGDDHPPLFNCDCFRCYMNYWVKWDSSSNRELIHEILDAFEENLSKENRKEENNRRERRKRKAVRGRADVVSEETKKFEMSLTKEDLDCGEATAAVAESSTETSSGGGGGGGGDDEDSLEEEGEEEEELEKGSVRRFVNFLGERLWGVWG